MSQAEGEELRPDGFPRSNFIQNIEALQKACGWRLDARPISQSCAALLKTVKANDKFVVEVITSEDSLVLTTLLSAVGSNLPPRLTEPALNFIHRLIAAGLIVGQSGNGNGIVDTIVEKICDCGASSSEDVQLAVLKALLTICTSETFCVKGQRLLQAFKMIFNLAVGSSFDLIKSSAVASLQQLLSVWFRKAAADFSSDVSDQEGEGGDVSPSMAATPTGGSHADLAATAEEKELSDVTANIANLAEKADISGLEKVLTSRLTDSTDNAMTPRGTGEGAEVGGRKGGSGKPGALPLHGLEADLFVLLRSLCRLAARTIESSTSDYFVIEGKLLALGLIKHVLQFQAWDDLSKNFIQRARNLLCVMLIRNANCSIASAAVKQIEILTKIILQPRILAAMKPEAGAFMPLLMIRHLEVFSPEPHLLKAACSALGLLCSNEQLLVDLFVNYDCEMNATNIFERIIKGLCYVIVSKPTYDAATESKVKVVACKSLFWTLTALHNWFREHQGQSPGCAQGEGSGEDGASAGNGGNSGDSQLRSRGQEFLRAKNKKDSLSGGIDLFNCNPVKGMKTLIKTGVVEGTLEAQAEFLYKNQSLSKAAKGEFLGHHEENQVSVMHKYADFFDFSGMEFDEALRVYLESFRLPGEAQQIDRIMEKFADRYCTCNGDTFSSADQAYMLGYAIIMLNTDIHNPLAEHMMDKTTFIGMVNQPPGEVEDGEEHQTLAEEYLAAIFDRIAANQITTSDEGDKPGGAPGAGGQAESPSTVTSPLMKVLRKALPIQQRPMGDDSASQVLTSLDKIKDLMKKNQGGAGGKVGTWNTAVNSEIAILMCGTICKHAMDIFNSLDKIKVSMDCFNVIIKCIKEAIIVTGLMDQKESCDTLVCTLSNLVGFSEANTFALALPDSMRIEAFRSLADIVLHYPDVIQGAWTHVFRCISIGQYFALQGSSDMEVMRRFDRAGYDLQCNNVMRKSTLLHFFEVEGLQLIDQIFAGSGNMNGQNIVMFVSSMCAVSREELETPIFKGLELILLQRLVETVYHNLNRIRMVWSRLWAVTSAHLVGAGCEDSEGIAMYSIDALRQIVSKLLEHQELSNFKFQDEAIKPFVSIFRQSELNQVHVFTIQCILQVVSSWNAKLKAGWHSILACVRVACKGGKSVEVVEAALHIMQIGWCDCEEISQNAALFESLKGCFVCVMQGKHVEHQRRAIEIVSGGETGGTQGKISLLLEMGNAAFESDNSCYHQAYQAMFKVFGGEGTDVKFVLDTCIRMLEENHAPLVALAIQHISQVPEEMLSDRRKQIVPLIVNNIESEDSQVRTAVADFLQAQVKPLLVESQIRDGEELETRLEVDQSVKAANPSSPKQQRKKKKKKNKK